MSAPTSPRLLGLSPTIVRRFADGGQVQQESTEAQLARMRAKYGLPAPQPAAPTPLPRPQAPQPRREPQGIIGLLRGRREVIDKASGFAQGGLIRGPGTPTSDSIPAQVRETKEPIKVSTGERILSKAQDAYLNQVAQAAGYEGLDAMLHDAGLPVGPTLKAGKRHAATGMAPDDETWTDTATPSLSGAARGESHGGIASRVQPNGTRAFAGTNVGFDENAPTSMKGGGLTVLGSDAFQKANTGLVSFDRGDASGGLSPNILQGRGSSAPTSIPPELQGLVALQQRAAPTADLKQAPARDYWTDLNNRKRLIDAASTPYAGSQNGQLTANQIRTLAGVLESDQRSDDAAQKRNMDFAAASANTAATVRGQDLDFQANTARRAEERDLSARRYGLDLRQADQADTRLDLERQRLAQSGGLTAEQLRGNLEIDAARKRIGSLTPDEIRTRTSQYSATGRENAAYDPTLEKAVGLANRRKIGDDPVFDHQDQARAPGGADVQARFRGDPAMKGYRLGQQGASGYEVFDANGRLVGHWN